MKRIRLFLFLFFLAFTLTSCNQLPDEVEEYTKEYCEQNPESELCKADVIDNLQETQIETLFWEMKDSTLPVEEFCEMYISLSSDVFYQECLEGEIFFPEELEGYTISDIVIVEEETSHEITITLEKSNIDDIYTFTTELVFINNDIYVHAWMFETDTPLNYQTRLEQFISGLNSVSLSDQEVCGEYLEEGKGYQECVLKRVQVINVQETISMNNFEWLNVDDLQFKFMFISNGEDGEFQEELVGSFYVVEETILIDLIIPFGISQLERTALLGQFVSDVNDVTIDSLVIAEEYLTLDSEMHFLPIREDMLMYDYTIVDHEVTFGSTYFTFELSNGDVYDYEVTFEYATDRWIMHWDRIYDELTLTRLDKFLLMQAFLADLYISSDTHEAVCDAYLVEESELDCTTFRTSLLDNDDYLQINATDYTLSPTPIEFLIYDDLMYSSINYYLHYLVDFVVIDNFIYMNFMEETMYYPLSIVDVELYLEEMVEEMNDFLVSDTSFCDIYGHLFIDCMETRSMISIDMWMAALESVEEIGEDRYVFVLGLYDTMMRLAEEITFDVTVYEDMEENTIIMGSIISDVLIPPDEHYDTIFFAFLEDYFTSSVTDQDIYDSYNDGWEFEGLLHRNLILEENLTYEVDAITWHADMGYTWYEATVRFSYPDDSFFIATIKYELFPGIDDYLFRLAFDWEMPSEYTITQRTNNYLADLESLLVSDSEFCNEYASSYDYDNCLRFREQFLAGEYTANLGELIIEEYYASFITEFTDSGDHYSELNMIYHPEHDLFAFPWLMVRIGHPDTDLLASFSNYINNGLIYGFNTHGINITTFCNEFAVCGTAFDDITSTVHHLTFGEVKWDLTDFFHPELQTIIVFEYYDGVIETHRYYGTYEMDGEYYIWTLHFIEKVLLE